MRIVNVICVETGSDTGSIVSIHSFVIDKATKLSNVKKAEALFKRKVKELAPNITKEEMDECLANSVYSENDEDYREVSLVWSNTIKK